MYNNTGWSNLTLDLLLKAIGVFMNNAKAWRVFFICVAMNIAFMDIRPLDGS